MKDSMDLLPADIYYDGILPSVEKPSRYIDRELNLASAGFDKGSFNVLLVFPDLYEIGMSHQGLRLLYDRVARMPGVGIEFAFAPWPDMERRMRECGEPVRSWQTGTPMNRFDLVGFTISHELHYTNILMMLDLSGIPLAASDRGGADPLVVAGGVCTTNPLPVLKAFDAVFMGDGEESLTEAVENLKELRIPGTPRGNRLRALSSIEGVYVEGISGSVRSRVYEFRHGDLPRRPIVPSAAMVHERLTLEILRGCTRGCRFCHAGMAYRPRRERSIDEIFEALKEGLDSSGWEEVSLLSLSTSDYSGFSELIGRIGPELLRRNVSLSLPSLRPETVCEKVVAASAAVRKSGFTIAPEAGTERLRQVINKGLTDGDILRGCSNILDAGWQTLKLYFMIGLPTETEEDIRGITALVEKVLSIPRRRGRFTLSVSVSPFVPRVHTPFQWERQCSMEEIAAKERLLSSLMRRPNVQLSMREPKVSALEGIFARGTEELWPVLVSAYEKGCRFDAWRDHLRFDTWIEALSENGLGIDALLAGRSTDTPLPWSRFESRVSESFLLRELRNAYEGKITEDCRTGPCSGCGACSGERSRRNRGDPGESAGGRDQTAPEGGIGPRLNQALSGPGEAAAAQGVGAGTFRYRFTYSKTGRARFLSHRELINIFQRALRRTGLPLKFSEGFHPHPKISLGPALATGMEGLAEMLDIELDCETDVCPGLFRGLLPEGIEITGSAGPFKRGEGRLPGPAVYRYRMETGILNALMGRAGPAGAGGDRGLPGAPIVWYRLREVMACSPLLDGVGEGFSRDPAGWLAEKWRRLFETGAAITDRRGREKTCSGCSAARVPDEDAIELILPDAAPGPADLLAWAVPNALHDLIRIRRIEIVYNKGGGPCGPLDLIEKNHLQE